MDAGGDCVALCDAGASGGNARVVGQWVYDAYWNVISADHLYPHAFSHVGHKGLFIDRLDAGVADHGDDEDFEPGMFIGSMSCEFDVPRVVPFAKHLYHNRNRAYLPNIGRFAQADPNGSGIGIAELPLYHGRKVSSVVVSCSVESRYHDGGSLYGYLGLNPRIRCDEMGLSWDSFELVDDYMSTSTGSSVALMERLVGTVKAGAYITATMLSYVPMPAVSLEPIRKPV